MQLIPRPKIRVGARLLPAAFALLALAFALAPARLNVTTKALAQDGARQKPEEIIDDDEVLKIDTDLVLVEVNVTDAEGKPVRGLRPEDFKLYMDGDERPVAFLQVERRAGSERPVAVVFAADVSGRSEERRVGKE